jgi:hypothetical protein
MLGRSQVLQRGVRGGEERRSAEIVRGNRSRDATELSQRRVTHASYTRLGFVCGEAHEWPERELAAELHGVDVVVVSAQVEVNRIWEREIDPELNAGRSSVASSSLRNTPVLPSLTRVEPTMRACATAMTGCASRRGSIPWPARRQADRLIAASEPLAPSPYRCLPTTRRPPRTL